MSSALIRRPLAARAGAFYQLAKPRVVALLVFTAVTGMFLATPGMVPLARLVAASLGIALTAAGAAALNSLLEQGIDALMARTRARPLPRGQVTVPQALGFAAASVALGLFVLHEWVNALTMWLTFGTFIGYAVVYTVILKPLTPQNIVIGGASGAMPPVLGWTAVAGEVAPEALLLFLIVFAWTPPHFWMLALYRRHDYERVGMPMLPVTHGTAFTRLAVLLYTVILALATLLPFATRMSGYVYLGAALALDAVFLGHALRLYCRYTDDAARRAFRFSIGYLAALFAALLVDHHLRILP